MLSGSFAESRKCKIGDTDGDGIGRYNGSVKGANASTLRHALRCIYADDAKSVLGGLGHTDLIALARLAI